jgi:hypothetical protein
MVSLAPDERAGEAGEDFGKSAACPMPRTLLTIGLDGAKMTPNLPTEREASRAANQE